MSSTNNGRFNKWRIPRLVVYLCGVVTIFWFFFSFIGLIIGVIYFVYWKDIAWKRHGIALALYIGFITVLTDVYNGLAPLNLAIYGGLLFITAYTSTVLIYGFLQEKNVRKIEFIPLICQKLSSQSKRVKKSLKILLIVLPTISWTLVNIDLGLMFDNTTRLLWVNAPSKVRVSETFQVTVQAWDPYERLSANYRGTVEFSVESYNPNNMQLLRSIAASLPEPYTFTGQIFGSDIAYEIKDGKDNGMHVFDASIRTPGIHYLLVKDSTTNNVYYSNPIVVGTFLGMKRIAWGDIHSHSILSDGTGNPDHHFYFAREVACLDFNALTDHAEILMWNPLSLDILERETNKAYEPGEFVTFHGIEWTNVRTGHYVCVFSGDVLLKSPVLDSYLQVTAPEQLWNVLDNFTAEQDCKALALPHHTTKKTYIQDWTYMNPKYVKIAEVTSVHGEFLFEQRHPLNYRGAIDPPPEYVSGSSIIDALSMGKRLTLYAASDEHDGHPGHSLSHTRACVGQQRPYSTWHTRNEHPYPGGLTAVHVDGLTRESVFDGLYNQRIFANSDHGRPILHFTINGQDVGDGSTLMVERQWFPREIKVILAQDGVPPALKSMVASVTANWIPDWDATIEIIKNGQLWRSIRVSEPVQEIMVTDLMPITGASYEDRCITEGNDSYINSYSDNPINPSKLNTGGFDYYLVRIVGDNGRTSYIGPIWIGYE